MLAIIIIVYIVLIFPLFININVKYLKNINNLEYQIKLFKFITIFFGYIELIDEGIAIHVNNKKAILIFYKDIFSMRKKFKPLKDYHIFKLNTAILIGGLNNKEEKLGFCMMYSFISNIIGQYFSQIKPYLTLKSNISFYDNKDMFMLRVRTTFVFNLLMVLISFIKIILEKII